ncbi:MAG: GldM family protein [Flavobacteriaceae bacterium]
MAGAKQDTRQKMINMMYLVFIAMLALNISKEVLATLGLINDDISQATQDLVADSDEKYTTFSNNANNEYYRVAAENMPKIQKVTNDYYAYIESLKQQLIASGENGYLMAREDKTTGVVDTIVDYQIMDKSQYLDELFFAGDQYTDKGQEFIDRFSSFPSQIQTVLDAFVAADLEKDPPTEELPEGEYADFDFSFLSDLNQRFAYAENVLNRDGKYVPYLNYHFEGFPLIASLSKLTKTQSDIRFVENKILENILSTINAHEGGLNKYQTLLESSKSSYYTNELVDASVVMGKKDSNFKPSRVELSLNDRPLVLGRDFTIAAGGVQLNKKFSAPGSYKLTGKLFFERNNEEQSVDVAQVISVIDKPNDAVISADQMKVVYRGLPNDLSISIPGIPNNKLSVRATNGKIRRKGNKFLAIPDGDKVGKSMRIFVSGEINGATIDAPGQDFRIKPLPAALGSIDLGSKLGKFNSGEIIREYVPAGTIAAKFPDDFDYNLNVTVKSFNIKVGSRAAIPIKSNRINDSRVIRSYLENASKGDIIFIYNIDAQVRTETQVIDNVKVTDFALTIK